MKAKMYKVMRLPTIKGYERPYVSGPGIPQFTCGNTNQANALAACANKAYELGAEHTRANIRRELGIE